ncbi:MAG: hypothetical protein AB1591_05840 [Pseudomonadota bacterium]
MFALVRLLLIVLAPSVPGMALAAYTVVNPAYAASHASAGQPRKILLLPPQINVAELSAGGVILRQDDWSRQAGENLLRAAEALFRAGGRFETVPMPRLSAEESEKLESLIGLYGRIAQAIHMYGSGRGGGWEHKKTAWDYTLGDGLSFLREASGADAALVFSGADIISTASRRTAFAVGLLIGVNVPLGQSFISAGLIDLKTGDIRWLSYEQSMTLDSRDPAAVRTLVNDLLAPVSQPCDGAC